MREDDRMRKYIFLDYSAMGIGGGQLYLQSKAEHLFKNGYQVFSFSTVDRSNEKRNSKYFTDRTIPELSCYPCLFSKRRIDRIVEDVSVTVGYNSSDEIIIESLSVQLSIWGEIIAKRLLAKHIIFSLSEKNSIDAGELNYLVFKIHRGELASINPDFFYGVYDKPVGIDKTMVKKLVAHMNDGVTSDNCFDFDEITKSDVNICVFGRLEKQYVLDAQKALVKFAANNNDKSISISFVGGTANSEYKATIANNFSKLNNVDVHMLGEIYPVPEAMFASYDLIIAGAGCATMAYMHEALTIAMDVKNGGMPLGVMGIDTVHTLYSDCPDHPRYQLEELIELVLCGDYLKKYPQLPPRVSEDNCEYPDFWDFLKQSNSQKDYYDCSTITISIKKKLRNILYRFFRNRTKVDLFLSRFI